MKKILIATALVLGATTASFAEDSSSSFAQNIYGPQAAPQRVLQSRNVALPAPAAVNQAMTFDRAGNPYAGGGF